MRAGVSCLTLALVLAGLPTVAGAGQDAPNPIGRPTALVSTQSRIEGTVRDETGRRLGGARVVAFGHTVAEARTDAGGRFALTLASGTYVIRVSRDGYLPAPREAVRLLAGSALRRTITLVAAGWFRPDQDSYPSEASAVAGEPVDEQAAARATAWRLRYLPRTVLRDGASVRPSDEVDPARASWRAIKATGGTDSMLGSGELAGHVDLLTMSSMASGGARTRPDWPRGVAYVAVRAPVADHGEWTINAAMSSGDRPAWTFVGDYRTRRITRHTLRVRSSYSAQTMPDDTEPALAGPAVVYVRRAGGLHVSDRWELSDDLSLEYQGQLERYDYLARPNVMGGGGRIQARLAPRVSLRLSASSLGVAPGALEFAPPSASGAWLPPDRTFSSWEPGQPMATGRVGRLEGVAHVDLGPADSASPAPRWRGALSLGRIREQARDQFALLFVDSDSRQAGHYFIASTGNVTVDAWSLGFDTARVGVFRGRIEYVRLRPLWTSAPGNTDGLHESLVPPSHDVTSTFEVTVPGARTVIAATVRASDQFRSSTAADPSPGARFAIDLRQPVPGGALGGRSLLVVVSARTLVATLVDRGAFYDELLAIQPPLRLTAGLEMRF